MANGEYVVATTAQLVGARDEDKHFQNVKTMDYASKANTRNSGSAVHTDVVGQADDETAIFTRSRHALWNNNSPTTTNQELLLSEHVEEDNPEILKPVAFSPSSANPETIVLKSSASIESRVSVKERVQEFESQISSPSSRQSSDDRDDAFESDNPTHVRSHGAASTSPACRGRRSQTLDIYFTPTDYTRSRIFLSSPQNSPTLPHLNASRDMNDTEDNLTTTPARAKTSRCLSDIYVGAHRIDISSTARNDKLKITPEQLDSLLISLVQARMIQKDVRKHWWDIDDIPDDETMSSFAGVSIPTLTSASTLYSNPVYSQPNQNFVLDHRPASKAKGSIETGSPKGPSTPKDEPFGGVALTDPKIHGSPIRFVSKDYRTGTKIQAVGACSFVQVPYGVDVECNLRVIPRSSHNTTCRVMFQCVNQVVDRKTGNKTYLLVADVDVTESFAKAALAELSSYTGKDIADIEVVSTPTSSSLSSPEIDWCAVADELQTASETAALVDNTVAQFHDMTKETCHMQSITLLTTLERTKDQHQDFLILRPTAFHGNGVPQSMKLPFVSQRLYHDWYEMETSMGNSSAAKGFQEQIVVAVAKHAANGEKFTTKVRWENEWLVIQCVPLSEGAQGSSDAWACFVRGVFDI